MSHACYPKCKIDNWAILGKRPNPEHPKSSDYGLVGCYLCGRIWEMRPEYEVEDRFGAGPAKDFEVTKEYAIQNYPNLNKERFDKVLKARLAA